MGVVSGVACGEKQHTKSSKASLMAVTTKTNTKGRIDVIGVTGLIEGTSCIITTIKK